MAPTSEELRDGFRGALLGTLVGEALGALTKGWSPARLAREGEGIAARLASGEVAGQIGDDGHVTIALAEWLLEDLERNPAHLAARLVALYDPAHGYGRGTTDVIRRLRAGADWETASLGTYPRGSFGNGAAARIAPCALLLPDDTDGRRRLVEDVASVTHGHPLGIAGAVLQAEQIAEALDWRGTELDPGPFVHELREATSAVEFRLKLQAVAECLEWQASDALVRDRLGCNETALGSVVTALHCFLAHPESFEVAVGAAVLLGGDADSLGAMAGAIAGAYHGAAAIPLRWRTVVEPAAARHAEELAHRLLERRVPPRQKKGTL